MIIIMKTLRTYIVFSIFSQTLISAYSVFNPNGYNGCMEIMKRLCNIDLENPKRIHCEKGAILRYRKGGYVPELDELHSETKELLPDYIHEYFEYLYSILKYPGRITTLPSEYCEGRGDYEQKCLNDMAEIIESRNYKRHVFFDTNLKSNPEDSFARPYLVLVSDIIQLNYNIADPVNPYMFCYNTFVDKTKCI